MDRPGPSFNMGSPLPGQVNGGFTMSDGDDITVTSMSGNNRVATRKATEDRFQAFADPDRIEKGEPKFESFTEEYPADPSILSAMERTLAAFMNQGLLLVGIGTALMTFNQYGPNIVGWVLVPVGVLHIVWSWYEFYLRLHRLQKGSDRPLSNRRSLWWTGALVLLIVAASAVELSCLSVCVSPILTRVFSPPRRSLWWTGALVLLIVAASVVEQSCLRSLWWTGALVLLIVATSAMELSFLRSLWWTGALVLLIVAASAVELSCNIIYGAFVRVTFPDGEQQGMATTANP
ncbi:uncharacterized protein LOC118431597 [Branchiostoma floridae]|uniref:Uncharacterized protein LOC118431597 n=1 Tax=Branchiostoma floridae TaxID=7739 RepID=A0A9J7NA77_BRAFL|nr:uncharacterized protein LOC118431597 [Branchiostoma floridae]